MSRHKGNDLERLAGLDTGNENRKAATLVLTTIGLLITTVVSLTQFDPGAAGRLLLLGSGLALVLLLTLSMLTLSGPSAFLRLFRNLRFFFVRDLLSGSDRLRPSSSVLHRLERELAVLRLRKAIEYLEIEDSVTKDHDAWKEAYGDLLERIAERQASLAAEGAEGPTESRRVRGKEGAE